MADNKKKKGGSGGKVLLLLILLAGAGTGVYVNNQDDSYDVNKSITIEADADDVWEYVGDFKNWREWTAWAEKDPTLKWTHQESSTEVGDSMSWSGKDGDGKMNWTAIDEEESASYDLTFGDYPTSKGGFKLVENENDTTTVTWTVKGNKGGFFGKASFLFKGYSDEIGADFEKGLANLKAKVEAE